MQKAKKYNHLTEQDISDAIDIKDIMQELDEDTKKLVIVYARGLKDMQDATKKQTA